MIRPFADHTPNIAKNAYIDDTALLIGQVTLGEHSSIWPMSVLRGDVQAITIGAGSLVPPNKTLESGYLWVGKTPPEECAKLTDKELDYIQYSAANHVSLAKKTHEI